jgi:tetratricopeptide (TPR) repeat protein
VGKEEIDVNRRRLLFGFMDKLRGVPESAPVASASETAPVLAEANAAFAAGSWEAAIAPYRKFLDAERENVEARQRLGECLYNLGRYIPAKVEFERIMQKNRNNNRAIVYLGLVLARLERVQKAAVVWKLHFDPHNVALQRELNLQIALVESAIVPGPEGEAGEEADTANLPDPLKMAEAVERALSAKA